MLCYAERMEWVLEYLEQEEALYPVWNQNQVSEVAFGFSVVQERYFFVPKGTAPEICPRHLVVKKAWQMLFFLLVAAWEVCFLQNQYLDSLQI